MEQELRRKLTINEEDYLLAVSQHGSGPPAASTLGKPGVLYLDTEASPERLYICTAANAEAGVYTWRPFEELLKITVSGDSTVVPGEDGITPHIGENGNWYLGNTDTSVKAAGTDGVDGGYYSPEITPNEADNSFTITFKASKSGMPAVAPATIKLPEKSNDSGENPAQGGLTAEQVAALYNVLNVCTFTSDDVSSEMGAFRAAFGISDTGGSGGGSEEGDSGASDESGWTAGVAYVWENVMGAYVDNNNGAFVAYTGYSRTPYLACAGAEILRAEVVEQSTSMSRSNSRYNAFYDAERRFISAFTSVDTDAPAVGTYTDIAVPANAAFFVVSHKDNVMGATNAGIPYIRFIPYSEVPV